MPVQPVGEAAPQRLAERGIEQLGGERLDLGCEHALPGPQAGHRRTAPEDLIRGPEGKGVIPVRGEGRHPVADQGAQGAVGRGQQAPGTFAHRPVGDEAEALENARPQPLHEHFAPFGHHRHQLRRVVTGDDGGGPVHELLGEPLVERVGETVLDRAGPLLPVTPVGEPGRAVRDVGPGPDGGDAREQGVQVAVGAVQLPDLCGHPVLGQAVPGAREMVEDVSEQAGVGLAHPALEGRDLADRPQQGHAPRARAVVVRLAHAHELGARGRALQAQEQEVGRREVQVGVAPVDRGEGREAVALHRPDKAVVEGAQLRGGAEAAVPHVAARTPRDLAHLRGGQLPRPHPVELAEAREHHVVDVQVQPHPDGVRGHEVIHLARLVEGDLRVASARGEGPEHEGRPPALAAQPLRDRVELAHGEDNDRAPAGELPELPGRGVAQGGEARARQEAGVRQQAPEQGADCLRPDQHGLELPAGVQDALREDVAALAVRGELYLVHRQEVHPAIHRHGLDRAEEVAGMAREDPLLAGYQGHRLRAQEGRDAVIVLPGQQAQGEADHPRAMGEHPLEGEVGLARVGGAEQGGDGFHEERGPPPMVSEATALLSHEGADATGSGR